MINTDMKQIITDKKDKVKKGLLYEDLTYKVRGAIFAVYNELGFGHKENIYQKALVKEFETLKIPRPSVGFPTATIWPVFCSVCLLLN